MSYSWSGSKDRFYETFKRDYDAIKSVDPEAIVAGPNTGWADASLWKGPDGSSDRTWLVRDFLDYCYANDCVPDVLTLRDYSNDGLGMIEDVEAIRQYFSDRGDPVPPLEQDDIGSETSQYRPGVYVSYFASIEKTGIDYTARCCWDWGVDCGQVTLNSCLTADGRKRSTWWAYKAYADITGNIIGLTGDGSVDGVAGIDQEDNRPVIRAVLGRYRDESGSVNVRLENLPPGHSSAHVLAQRIPNTESGELESLETVFDQEVAVDGRSLSFSVSSLGAYEACAVTVTLDESQTTALFKFPERTGRAAPAIIYFPAIDKGMILSVPFMCDVYAYAPEGRLIMQTSLIPGDNILNKITATAGHLAPGMYVLRATGNQPDVFINNLITIDK
jgi:hypothetical protein